jgi:quinolinate synthase
MTCNADIINKIESLKDKRNAVILVHNYQVPEVQDIGDYVGDSLELAKISHNIDCKIILFCGVHFMAETAKIFNPEKKVLMPDLHAGCPMADMITAEQLQKEKKLHLNAAVVTYINSTAQVKALSDVCCTSANGVQVVKSIENQEIIFVPDKYLGSYVAKQVSDKTFHLWPGYCPTHMVFSKEGVLKIKEQHPNAKIVVHPECRIEVQEIGDRICSTSQMVAFARESDAQEFIICTEVGMLYRLHKENPNKEFFAGDKNAVCPNMKLTNLEKVLWSLEDLKYEIEVEEAIRVKALGAIERMVKL